MGLRKILPNLCLLIFSLGLCLLLAEFICRLYVKHKRQNYFSTQSFEKELLIHTKSKAKDKDIVFELKPNTVTYQNNIIIKINSHGFRDYEYNYFNKSSNTLRILCLGDSVTFGFGLKLEDSYTKLLETKLNSISKRKVEVLNTGVCNYNLDQETAFFANRGVKYKPDVLLLYYILNDSYNDPLIGMYAFFKDYKPKSWLVYFLNNFTDSVRWKVIRKLYKVKTGYKPRNNSEVIKFHLNKKKIDANLRKISEIARKNNVRLLMVIQPMFDRLNGDYEYPDVHIGLKSIAKKYSFEVIDLYSYLKKYNEKDISLDICHPNEKGSMIIADILYEHINVNSGE